MMNFNLGFQCEVTEGDVKRIGRYLCDGKSGKVVAVVFDESLACSIVDALNALQQISKLLKELKS